jgi:BlaR1 peptidase M56
MPEWILYLLKFNISILLVFLFYWLFLRKLTFYSWNRLFLVGYSCLCFIVPFVDIYPLLDQTRIGSSNVVQSFPIFHVSSAGPGQDYSHGTAIFNAWNIILSILAVGFIVMIVRLFLQCKSLAVIRRSAKLVSDLPVKLYQVDDAIIPFSFGNGIFINPKLHQKEELETIINHEFIHVKQKHTVDILLSEFLCAIAWYNPAAWMIRHAIRQNLEFIADNYILKEGTDRKTYQYLLLKVLGTSSFRFTNSFNYSSLKKRILMMNKIKTAKSHLIKFLLFIPLVFALLLSFRNQPGLFAAAPIIQALDTFPKAKPKPAIVATSAQPAKGVIPTPIPTGDARGISIDDKNKATVELKNRKIKTYNLNNSAEKKAFENKYGKAHGPSVDITVDEIAVTSNVSTAITQEPMPVRIAANVSNEVSVASIHNVSVEETEEIARTVGAVEEFSVKGLIILELNKNSSRARIEELQQDLKKRGYEFQVNEIKYDNDRLVSIDGFLAKGLTKSYFSASEFSSVIVTELKNKKSEVHFQFYVEKGRLHVK